MDYFREKLMTYSTERQISTLLHIHTEISKPKVLIPSCKTQNYVDQILNQYSVKMYTYPQLSQAESRIAYSIQHNKRAGTNVFSLQQFKRKPLKKKISKKVFIPPPPVAISTTQFVKLCPCCGSKVNNKHRCQHSLCQKPCSRSRKPRVPTNIDQKSVTLSKKKKIDEEEQFSPEGEQVEAQQRQSSALEHQSDFQDDMDMIGEFSGTESFLSNIDRKKGKSRRKGGMRKDSSRNRGNKKRRFQHRRTFNRNQSLKKEEQQNIQAQGQNQQQNQKQKILSSSEKMQLKQNFELNEEKKQNQGKSKPNTRKKKTIRKMDKKQSLHSQSNIQSSFEPLSPRKDLRKKRSSTMVKKTSFQNSDKESLVNNDGDKYRKKQPLSYFCTPEQLKQNQIFNIRIVDTEFPTSLKRKSPNQKSSSEKNKPQLSLMINRQFQKINSNIEKSEIEIMKAEPNGINEQVKNRQSEQFSENGAQYQQQPQVNAVLDPVSDYQNQDGLFKNSEQVQQK